MITGSMLVMVLTIGSISSSPTFSRSKREAISCRQDGIFVPGEIVAGYLPDIDSEQACVEQCEKFDECQAVNYFPSHQACLLQKESLVTNSDLLEKRTELSMTVYVIVKGCEGSDVAEPSVPEAQQERQKRESDQCRRENLFVGGTAVQTEYVKDVDSEDLCVQKCQESAECNAVNYFPQHKACLRQVQTLISHKDQLETYNLPDTVYIIVKGCNQMELIPDDGSSKPSNQGEMTLETRKKREVPEGCRKEGLIVGAESLRENYVFELSEDACVEECEKEAECRAVNYFVTHKACLLQRENLATDSDRLLWIRNPSAVYVVVKGCDGSLPEPNPELEVPQPEPEEESEESDEEPEPEPEEEEDDEMEPDNSEQ